MFSNKITKMLVFAEKKAKTAACAFNITTYGSRGALSLIGWPPLRHVVSRFYPASLRREACVTFAVQEASLRTANRVKMRT